jgi:hypothetical protein
MSVETRLIGRADTHDKQCFGSPMGLGYFSGNDARLLRDAAARIHALEEALEQCRAALAMMIEPETIQETSTLRAWSHAVEAERVARAALNPKGGK